MVRPAPLLTPPPARPATSQRAPEAPVRSRSSRALLLLALSLLLFAGSVLAGSPGARAETPPDGLGGFSPNFLITDTRMFDSTSMTRAQVDAFLDEKGAN